MTYTDTVQQIDDSTFYATYFSRSQKVGPDQVLFSLQKHTVLQLQDSHCSVFKGNQTAAKKVSVACVYTYSHEIPYIYVLHTIIQHFGFTMIKS